MKNDFWPEKDNAIKYFAKKRSKCASHSKAPRWSICNHDYKLLIFGSEPVLPSLDSKRGLRAIFNILGGFTDFLGRFSRKGFSVSRGS